MRSAGDQEETIDLTPIRASPVEGPPVALPESLQLVNSKSPTPKPGDRVILASPSILNTIDDDPTSAVLVKPPSPPPPHLSVHSADIVQAAPDTDLSIRIPDLSLHEDASYQLLQEHEAERPLTTSPSPLPSPVAPGSRGEANPDHPTEESISSVSETRATASNPELETPVNTEPTLTSFVVDEVMRSPVVTPLAVETSSRTTPNDTFKISDASCPKNADDGDEASTVDLKQSQIAEQRDVNMDVDEELLSLIGDDLPSRGSQTKSKKHDFVSFEGKKTFCSPLLEQESTPNRLFSPDPPPVVTASALEVKQERASALSTDTAMGTVGTRDSETGALKLEERLSQKKKVNLRCWLFIRPSNSHKAKHHPQPKSRVKPSGSMKTKPKTHSDGPSAASLKNKKLTINSTKKSVLTSRSRSTSAMPMGTNPVPGSESKALGEAELEGGEEGMEDKLYCVCKTKYDDESVMIACDRYGAA